MIRSVALSLALLVCCIAPASASAQAYEPYRADPMAPAAPSSAVEHVRAASDAAAVGDRAGARRALSEAARQEPDSSTVRLARASYRMRLDPGLSLRLSDAQQEQALAELDDIDMVSSVDCETVLLIVPSCASSGPNTDFMAGAAALGGLSLAVTTAAIGLMVDAGNRSGAWADRLAAGELSIGFSVSTEAASIGLTAHY